MMTTTEPTLVRSTKEVLDMIDRLMCRYWHWNPEPNAALYLGVGIPNEVHDVLIAVIQGSDTGGEQTLEDVLVRCGIDSPDALRAMLRLVTAHAAMTALHWALDKPMDIQGAKFRLDSQQALDEICGPYSD